MKEKGNIEDIYRGAFEDFQVEPSSKIWGSIRLQLFFYQFVRFNILTFNMYYLALLIGGAIFLGISLPDETKNTLVAENVKQSNDHEFRKKNKNTFVESGTITSPMSQWENQGVVFDEEIKEDITTNIQPTGSIGQKQDKVAREYVLDDQTASALAELDLQLANNKTIREDEKTEYESQYANTGRGKSEKNEEKETQKEHTPHRQKNETVTMHDGVLLYNTTNRSVDQQTNSDPEYVAMNQEVQLSELITTHARQNEGSRPSIESNNAYPETWLSNNKLLIDSPVVTFHPVEFDTIRVYDTIVFVDTIPYHNFQLRLIDTTKNWFAEVYYAPFAFNNRFQTNILSLKEYVGIRNLSEIPLLSHQFGLNLGYQHKNFVFRSGLSCLKYRNQMDYEGTILNIRTSTIYNYKISGQYALVDTIGWDLETIEVPTGVIESDTTLRTDGWEFTDNEGKSNIINNYTPITDTVWINTYDSTKVTLYDTTKVEQYYKYTNGYTYLQIPFDIGFQKHYGRFTGTLRAGCNLRFLLGVKGKVVSKDDLNLIGNLENEGSYKGVSVSLYSAFSLAYKLTSSFDVYAEPYLGTSWKSIYKNDYPLSHTFNSKGIRFGLRYRF